MDGEGWFSVTPERIAKHVADRCESTNPIVIIDAFCGMGGNAIQFALRENVSKVIAIEIDPTRMACAMNNAKVYGVEDKIEFIHGNCMELLPTLQADVVFLSPPWGGPSYLHQNTFDIESMQLPGSLIYEKARQVTENIIYFMPRNVNIDQMAALSTEQCHVEKQYLNEKLKCISVYYGRMFV